MPRLLNAENMLFKTFAVAACASNASSSGSFTGVTTADYCTVLYNDDTASAGIAACISAANTIKFQPAGSNGGGTNSAAAQTVGVLVMVNPTSGEKGGSW